MTPQVIAFMTAAQSLIVVAPDAILFAAKVKGWVADMFTSGLIGKEAQDALNARVTEICRAALNKEEPSHWQIAPDPQ